MATLKLNYRSKQEKTNLEIRLSYKCGGKYKKQRTRTQILMTKDFWVEYKSGKNFRDIDKKHKKNEADKQFRDLEMYVLEEFQQTSEIDPYWLKRTVEEFYKPKEDAPSKLTDYWEYYLELRKEELKSSPRNYQKYQEILNRVKDFEKKRNRKYDLADVNEEFVSTWIEYCLSQKYSKSTIEKNFSYIKTICRHAKKRGIELSPEFDDLKVSFRKENLPKVYLSFQEIEAIEKLTGLTEFENRTRDWLLISCHTGQRISDFMRFNTNMIRETKGRRFLDFKQIKTGKWVSVPLLPDVEKILKKYNGEFPEPINSSDYNKEIKHIAKKAGLTEVMRGKLKKEVFDGVYRGVVGDYPKWKLVTSHIGRRSLATNYYGKIPTSFLKNITAHSTEAMLMKYIGKTSKDTAYETYGLMTSL